MKQLFIACILSLVIYCTPACNSAQSEAQNTADAIEKTMKENTPGAIATSENGYYMTAKIDGKDWSASHMIPDLSAESNNKMIRGEKDGDNITFQLWKQGIEVGKKRPFSETNSAGFLLAENPALMSGQSGEVVVTKYDDQWLEGTFHFIARENETGKEIQVTDGFFRVASVQK